MLFLTKSSSARRSLLMLLLALCCLSCALGAKITKKVEKPPANENNNEDKAEPAVEAAEAAAEAADDNEDDDDDNDDDDEEEEADDDDDDDEEEEVPKKKKKSTDKDAAVAATTTTTTTNNKNEVKPAVDPTDLSVWGMVRTLWSWLRSDLSESLFGDDDEKPAATTTAAVEGRTFGKIRRLQMALIPIIFKFGVLSAMVAFLVAIGMKSLFLLKILVVMNALAILGKFLTLKTSLFGSYEHSAPSFSYPSWNTHAKESSWAPTGLSSSGPPSAPHPPSKEIHLHIHGNAQTQAQLASQGYNYETNGGWASRSDPYSAYINNGQYQEQPNAEVPNNTDPMSLLPTKYPARNLIR